MAYGCNMPFCTNTFLDAPQLQLVQASPHVCSLVEPSKAWGPQDSLPSPALQDLGKPGVSNQTNRLCPLMHVWEHHHPHTGQTCWRRSPWLPMLTHPAANVHLFGSDFVDTLVKHLSCYLCQLLAHKGAKAEVPCAYIQTYCAIAGK